MEHGSSDANSRVTVAILETEMGHIKGILVEGFDDAKRRDEKINATMVGEQKRLNKVILDVAVQEAALRQVVKNEVAIDAMKTDVIGLKAVSKKWGLAGMGASLTALATAAVAAFKGQ